MRITAVKGWDVFDETREFRICRSYGTDLGEAGEVEHRCDCPSCDIRKAAEAGFAAVAADLLAGATETPLLAAVERAHRFNGTAEPGEMYESDEWHEWRQHWQDARDAGRLWQCLDCNAWTWGGEHCGCCRAGRPVWKLRHLAYCGMATPLETFTDRDEARAEAVEQLRRYRTAGFPVVTLDRGRRWEILEPEDCG